MKRPITFLGVGQMAIYRRADYFSIPMSVSLRLTKDGDTITHYGS